MKKCHIIFQLNGITREVLVDPNQTLVRMLRDDLGLTGTKNGCGEGDCGSCTVLLDDEPVNSCLMLAAQVDGHKVTTIEGLADGDKLHPLQTSFIENGAIQCGFCTPGMILSATALLEQQPDPSELDIRTAISGNLCRCTGYQKIVEAVKAVATDCQGES